MTLKFNGVINSAQVGQL